ncbi:putative ribonuclease H-like domain-containing protein [Tanacetum coccineum]
MNVSLIPTTRINKDHPKDQIIGDLNSVIQTKRMTKISDEHAMVSYINKQRRTNHKDYQNCLFTCFLSQKEPKKVIQALADPSWVKAMQEELLQFKLQKVWTLVDLPNGKRAIGTKWVFKNKKDKRGIMDVKSAFLYGTIEKEVYVCQPPGFEDLHFPDKLYKVEKALYGLHQALRAWYKTLSAYLIENGFRRGTIDKTLFIKKDKGDILLVQDCKYNRRRMESSLAKTNMCLFDFATVKTASTSIETNKALVKDEEAKAVDVHLYRSMIRSLMYLTAFRPDIMFVVYACARFQVTPKTSHIHVVKRIFRYLKGQPKLGLWYSRGSPFDLEACSDSDYAGASLDKKLSIGEYVAAANCYETVYKEWEDRMERAATTASSLEAEQDSGSGPKCQVTILGVQKLKLGLRLHPNSPMIHLSQELTHLEVGRTFWATAKVKTVNGERQLQALVDKKKVIITETSIKSDLNLEDACGTDCLPTDTIFEELARMGYENLHPKLHS